MALGGEATKTRGVVYVGDMCFKMRAARTSWNVDLPKAPSGTHASGQMTALCKCGRRCARVSEQFAPRGATSSAAARRQ